MNLGTAFGIDKLRIWQLEDELERRHIRIVASTSTAPPEPYPVSGIVEADRLPRRGYDRGIGARVRAVLPKEPPGLNVSEIAARLGDIRSKTVSALLCQFDDVAHTGEWRHYRYYRKAAA